MHGSEKNVADFHASLMPLAKRIDYLSAQKERQFSQNEATSTRRQIDEADDWAKHDIKRKVAGKPPKPLESVSSLGPREEQFGGKCRMA